MKNESSVAVFIDVENIHYSTLNNYSETPNWARIVDSCKAFGRISSIQAFGDWIQFAKEVPEIQKNGIQPVFVPLSQDGKSSLDCYLTVSAMKLFFQNSSIDTLILASGDRDYIPMIAELKALGKHVIILAVPGSLSKDLTTIVDQVIDYKPNSKHDTPDKKTSSRSLDVLQKFVVETIKELEKNSINDRWVNLANVGLSLKTKDTTFSHNKYGYKKLVELLANLNGIEIKYDNYEKTNAFARSSKDKNLKSQNSSLEGTVLNKKDGYGFIKPEQGADTIFFHYTKLLNVKFWELNEGDKVTFTTYNTDRGLNAENIEKKQ